ncbi:MAG TPA: HAD-IA family hydrolase [Burkholderiaceae bacterium]|jgi:phosphoglycolate phosphatase|nr:HAD-IA family hydrolase [Burkholderiaceae bacterium]
MLLPQPRAILFDLDGTLVDTAPDLAGAINRLRIERGLPPSPYESLRPVASAGARGLIGAAFGLQPGDKDYEELRISFLDHYAASLAVESRLFEGVQELLDSLLAYTVVWGIVTNKASRFTEPLMQQIGLRGAVCVISGDTTHYSKPHPEPLLEATRRLDLAPQECWYVGDDLRDIEAGRAAGMTTLAAAWGYCGHTEPTAWGADAVVETPLDILGLVEG